MKSTGFSNPRPRMLPAHQRFERDGFARGQAHNRLVVSDQLVFFDGAPQIRLQTQARQRLRIHLGNIKLIIVSG